ncbi:MAG: hypothetical protein P1V18_04645 [Candidatus Gracilibacteria bacterium]|nr:hypothetical protein [Candidatus Gracilibacteria bacterium]
MSMKKVVALEIYESNGFDHKKIGKTGMTIRKIEVPGDNNGFVRARTVEVVTAADAQRFYTSNNNRILQLETDQKATSDLLESFRKVFNRTLLTLPKNLEASLIKNGKITDAVVQEVTADMKKFVDKVEKHISDHDASLDQMKKELSGQNEKLSNQQSEIDALKKQMTEMMKKVMDKNK